MTPRIRQLALTAHVTCSVGWIGALAVFFAHALASLISRDEQIVRAAALAMGLAAWFVILPLGLASLATGLVQALGTAWGLLRHYWVASKLLLTAVATIVLLLKLRPIGYLADVAASPAFSSSDLIGLRASLAIHAGAGLLVLLTAVTLAVCKPKGLIRRGMRVPQWVKVFACIVAVLILLIAAMLVTGAHGPDAHIR